MRPAVQHEVRTACGSGLLLEGTSTVTRSPFLTELKAVVSTLIRGVQSTDFSRAFPQQERTQVKLVLHARGHYAEDYLAEDYLVANLT